MSKRTKAQVKALATRRVRSDARYRQLLELSKNGVSLKGAAETVGLTTHGVKSLLHKQVGSQAWPIKAVTSADAILALQSPPAKVEGQCPLAPDGQHQVDTSMESGPNNCFHCGVKMGVKA